MDAKNVLLAVLIFCLFLMVGGGATYYAVLQRPAVGTEDGTAAKDLPGKTDGEAEAKRTAREKERADRREAKRQRDKQKEQLLSGMKVVLRNGAAYYTCHNDPEMSGIYLRPFIVEREGEYLLKNDVYYCSLLEDPDYGWIHGDRLDVQADDFWATFAFDASKRRDKLGKGAESLTENYVVNADAATVEMLKAVGNASHVTLHFYKEGSQGSVQILGREDIRRVRDMMALYEILKAEARGE